MGGQGLTVKRTRLPAPTQSSRTMAGSPLQSPSQCSADGHVVSCWR